MSSTHRDVTELPCIAAIQAFREQLAAPIEWRPVGIVAGYRTEIGSLDARDSSASRRIHKLTTHSQRMTC